MANTIYLEPDSTLIIEDSSGNTKFKISGSGEMTINGSILPMDTGSNDIGSQTKPFHDLFVTTESIKFIQNGSVVDTLDKDSWANVKTGRFDSIGQQDITIDGNFIPASDATYTLGTARKRFSRVYVASTIDVSGSALHISAPSASTAGDAFNIYVSGSILPSDTGSVNIGSEAKPFHDLYVTTESIKFVDKGSVVDTMTKDQWANVKTGRFDSIGQQDMQVDGNIIPSRDATYTLGAARNRFSRVYVASHIDVSGSALHISAPSASAAGDAFNIIISGSILPSDTSSVNVGSEAKPFHDLYVTTSSIKFVRNGAVVDTLDKDSWANVKTGRYDSIGQQNLTVDGNIVPSRDATYSLGTARQRFSRLYTASTIDVSGSQLIICAPSASAAGDDFNVVLSGSLLPADSDVDSIGSEAQPFKDLYVTTGSIIYVDRSYDVGHASRKVAFSRTDVERLREGKPLRATDARDDSDRVRGKMTGGLEITGSLIKDGVTLSATMTELNKLDGVTATTAELNILDGVTATTAELNIMDGVTATTTELNYVDGVTSAIQTQLSGKFSSTGGRLSGQIYERFTTFTDQDTTPSVTAGNHFATANTRATTISELDDIADGQEVTIVINDANTDFTHTSTIRNDGELKLSGGTNWTTAAAGDTITFIGWSNGSNVVALEKCRSDNTR